MIPSFLSLACLFYFSCVKSSGKILAFCCTTDGVMWHVLFMTPLTLLHLTKWYNCERYCSTLQAVYTRVNTRDSRADDLRVLACVISFLQCENSSSFPLPPVILLPCCPFRPVNIFFNVISVSLAGIAVPSISSPYPSLNFNQIRFRW